ncbi:hypothetical protein G7066_13305 [Leucobacter coleopterorum]|uniref:Uncharacterized protein n=1 Tax=Leucobacter coleopterorum TaxID=2714933 RepID=A0ABX6JU07_9MICO|nr:hypothetical protein [Leucobacter coleopterorum]QIM17491.1 hypothetical protein G7066_13305 [Leucobacter coleopterorum]
MDSKARSIEYLGGTWAVEHILRLNPPPTAGASLIADGLAFELGGAPLFADEIRHKLGQDRPRLLDTDGVEGAERLDNDSLGGRVGGKLARLRYSLPLRIADATGYLHRFNGAVVFEMTAKGGASLERLLRAGIVSPAVNAWAVAEAGSAAFTSLRRAGLPAVAAGSIRHFLLLKRARAVVSVSVDNHLPFPDRVLGKSWSNVYLNDTPLGARDYWTLNPSHVDLIAADNAEERQRLCGDGGYYRFFPEETLLLTGYRDRLIAGAFSADDSTTLNGIVDALPG